MPGIKIADFLLLIKSSIVKYPASEIINFEDAIISSNLFDHLINLIPFTLFLLFDFPQIEIILKFSLSKIGSNALRTLFIKIVEDGLPPPPQVIRMSNFGFLFWLLLIIFKGLVNISFFNRLLFVERS